MTSPRLILRYAGLAPGVLALGLALMIGGCSRDSDKVAVDFSKTVPVARPGDQGSSKPPLRVAVAAMISPPEALAELPVHGDVGAKKNSKGYKQNWIGYKLHVDVTDCGLPISAVLTAAERFNSRLKEGSGAGNVMVRGAAKVRLHLMLGVVALFADQLLKLVS
jgi:hypothetical protein